MVRRDRGAVAVAEESQGEMREPAAESGARSVKTGKSEGRTRPDGRIESIESLAKGHLEDVFHLHEKEKADGFLAELSAKTGESPNEIILKALASTKPRWRRSSKVKPSGLPMIRKNWRLSSSASDELTPWNRSLMIPSPAAPACSISTAWRTYRATRSPSIHPSPPKKSG